MRVTKIDKPVAVFRKALGYDPDIPDGDVEEPEFEGAFVLIPRDNSGIEFVPAPTVTDGDLDTYAETDAHDEAMRVTLDFPVRFTRIEVLGAWETEGERTYTLEGANLPDWSDAVELDSQTFDVLADWIPYEIVFDYDTADVAYQYYRLIGPDEERRWHNLRLIQASVDGCECIELCRDVVAPALVASNDAADLAQSDPTDLGAIPTNGNLWLIWSTASAAAIPTWDEIAGPMAAGGTTSNSMFAKEVEAGDNGEVTVGSATHWLTAEFSGVATTPIVVETLDDQSIGAGGGTLTISIDVPAGDHLVVAYFNSDNMIVPTIGSGWTLIETQSYATTKYQTAIYAFVTGGATETPNIGVERASSWYAFAAAFPVTAGEATIVGGPNATSGVADCAAPGDHDHAYTAEQIAFTPAGSIAATNVQDAIEEAVAEAGGGTPATTVESETTFGITPAVGTDTEYARQDHTHGTPADPTASPSSVWMPLTTVVGGEPELVWDGDDSLIPTLVPI